MSDLKRITLFADDPDDERSLDYLWVEAWLERWKGQVRVVDYSTGGGEHIRNLEAPAEAVAEIPEHLFCGSAWANPELGDCNPAKAAVEIAQAIIGRPRADVERACNNVIARFSP